MALAEKPGNGVAHRVVARDVELLACGQLLAEEIEDRIGAGEQRPFP